MTFAPRIPPLPLSDAAGVAAALRSRGGRLTQPRRQVLEALFAADGPVSAEYLAKGLGGTTTPVELTSVYRALENLEQLGVVRHTHFGHGPGLYALARSREREYLVCEQCDRVTAVDSALLDPIREQLRVSFGYRARFSHFPIVGLCDTCAQQHRAEEEQLGQSEDERSEQSEGKPSEQNEPAQPDEHTQQLHSHGHRAHSHARRTRSHEH
ncbi:MAG TPA: transcriptional repressor [Solirubrobacteraceae bacterium]|nr:transcriptional repressor [Solirubrobacteraceae bacterium]